MPLQRPTLQELINEIEADIEHHLPGADASLRRTVLGVLARVLAGALHGLYGLIAWIAEQVLPDVSTEWLDRIASIWGIVRAPAAFASGNLTINGTDGAVIVAGTEFKRADGVKYVTAAEATIVAGTATVPIIAELAGAQGLASAGAALNITTPIGGVTSAATVAVGGLTGGVDEETDDSLRTRLLARIQEPPHGGADFDYVTWAKEVPGVTRAWVYPKELGRGTVTVRFMMDQTYADGIPQEADEQTVETYIDTQRPVTADLTVVAPIAVPVNFEISGLNPSTQAVRDAITAELRDLIEREAEPAKTILISQIREAISIAAGETDHVLVSPIANIVHTTGQIATMGDITWS